MHMSALPFTLWAVKDASGYNAKILSYRPLRSEYIEAIVDMTGSWVQLSLLLQSLTVDWASPQNKT